ncbi:ankyrin repeat domain-containing protein [Saccharicrinis sp. 156]
MFYYDYDYLEMAKYLLEKGANVNAKNVRNQTPLSQAKAAGHIKMVQL